MKYMNVVRKYMAAPLTVSLAAVSAFPVLAAEDAGGVVGPDAWLPIVTPMTAQVNTTTIIGAIASVIVAVMGLVFMWWGLRKVVRMIMSAFRKGHISV